MGLVGLLLLAAVAQSPEPLPTGSRRWSLAGDAGGGTRLEFKWTLTKEPSNRFLPAGECTNACDGPKHPDHAKCRERDCDVACEARTGQRKHRLSTDIVAEELSETGEGKPKEPHAVTLSKVFDRNGIPGRQRGSTYTDDPVEAFLRRPSTAPHAQPGETASLPSSVAYELDHWNAEPCSTRRAEIGTFAYLVTVDYEIRDFTKNPNRTETPGPQSAAGRLRWRILVPDPKSIAVGEAVVSCKCEPKQEPKKEVGFLPGDRGQGETAYVEENGVRRAITGQDLKETFRDVFAEDMNWARMQTVGFTGRQVYVPAGWELQCTEGGGQNLQIQEPIFVAAPPVEASMSGVPAAQERRIRVLCLNIDKPEPKPGMAYRLVPPGDARVARLTSIVRAESVRGPWDQMRLWIATDAAPFDKIAKVLVPSPGPATYVRELYRAASLGAVSPFEARTVRLMEPRHLLAKNGDPAAVEWTLRTKLRADSANTLAWFRAAGPEVAAADAETVGLLASVLAREGGAERVKVALGMIGTAPESKGAPRLLSLLTWTSDAQVVEPILDWLLATRPSYAASAAAMVGLDLPPAILEKAARLRESGKAP